MTEMLSGLREDHRNMSIMLDLLEGEADSIRNGQAPDCDLLHAVMQYMTTYSDAVHHANENAMYRAMIARSPGLAQDLEQVGDDHRSIEMHGASLLARIDALAAGGNIDRNELADDATAYVRDLRAHMAWEETDLFVRADALARGEGSMAPEQFKLDRPDPLFGPKREHSFAELLRKKKEHPGEA